MKVLRLYFTLFLSFVCFLLSGQDISCNQFEEFYASGDYEKAIEALDDCKKASSLTSDDKIIIDYFQQISYYFINDTSRFNIKKLEELVSEEVLKNSPSVTNGLFILSRNYASLATIDKFSEFATRFIELIYKHYGNEHPYYTSAVTQIANLYTDLGVYEKAIILNEEVLKIRKKTLGDNHPDFATSLNNLGVNYFNSGNYEKAIVSHEQALKIRKQVLGENHPNYALTLSNLALDYSSIGNYEKAIELYEQALEIVKETHGENHRNYAGVLNNLAGNYSALGNYSQAIVLNEQALKIRKQTLGENHPDYARSLNNLASCYSSIGNYLKAIELYEQALKIRKEVLGENHPDYATSLNNLAHCYALMDNYQKAIKFNEQAMEIWKQIFGENHPNYAQSLNNLAGNYFDIGNYQKALELNEQALEIRKQALGEKHPDYAMSLNNLASIFFSMRNYQKAVELDEQALKIQEQILGKTHPDYAMSLNNLASYYSTIGNYQKAVEYNEQALMIRKQVFGEMHPDYAMSLNNLADDFYSMGNYKKAVELDEQALKIIKQAFGETHSKYALLLNNLALDFFKSENYSSSSMCFQQSFNLITQIIRSQFSWLSEYERTLFWNKNKISFMLVPSLCYLSKNYPTYIELSYDAALLSTGLLLQSSQELSNIIMSSGNKEVIQKADELRGLHFTLNKLYEKPISERYLNTDSLESVAQNLEKELLAQSKEYGDYTRFMAVTWQDVQKNLKDKEVAIEFVEFPILETDSIMYAALVLRKGWERPKMIPLFEKKQIEQYLKQTPDKLYSGYVGRQLYQLMWKPLEEVVEKGDCIYFSAAGIYYQTAVEYLPSDEGVPLCDLYKFRRLSSTRYLALEESNTAFKNATLYGGIQYDASPSQMLAESKKYQPEENLYAYRGMSDNALRGSKWVALDNTIPEVDYISEELTRNNIQAQVFTGTEANEESIKALSGKEVNILHLAIHGFFLPIEETRKVSYFQRMGQDNNPAPDMSMRRSGLIMAGGNNAWVGDTIPDGIDDGILTAQEISVLDFRGMDLVVLSACETGLGDISTSEGVFGLQRAFKKAGAKTLIMSLWKVNDAVTKSLMNKFYESLMKGKSKHEAFLEAQQFIRSRHPEPQNWAAFIMLD